ncbi:MAG: hypothetical protein ABDK92_06315 [Atribacterota bacterium]
MSKTSKKRKTSIIFWGLLCVFLGGVLWLVHEATLAFLVAGVVFGVATLVTKQENGKSTERDAEEAWKEIVKRLLDEEVEIAIRALVNEQEDVVLYREFIDPKRVLGKNARNIPNTGFEELFYCYFLLKCLSSCDLGKIEVMTDREIERWRKIWWHKWKEAFWSEVPSSLRQVLVDHFEE